MMHNQHPEPVAKSAPRLRRAADPVFRIVLKPVGLTDIGDIVIEDSLFAVGRSEAPFVSCPPEVVAELSRRHARIFSEFGAVYLADLDSKNGTTVNGLPVLQKPVQLADGDEICFARALSFRVQFQPAAPAAPTSRLLSLTLTPIQENVGLQPVVINRFPFLVGKTDEIFARYKEKFPHQVNYISRRHAHVFLKHGEPFVEDLGSTNGTFVDGQRLDEHAVPLREGAVLAFGGHHLAYRVSLQQETVSDSTATRLSLVEAPPRPPAGDPEKTTFLAAADSFLDIFCIEHPAPAEDEINHDVPPPTAEPGQEGGQRRRRPKWLHFIDELRQALASPSPGGRPRHHWAAAAAIVLALLAGWHFMTATPERQVKQQLADGDYAGAAAAARQALVRHPDSPELKALGKEALLKAGLPDWLNNLRKRDFAQAASGLAAMKELAAHNDEALALLGELEWIAALEQFVATRDREAPIRIYADEERIGAFLKHWDEDNQGRQRALSAIAAQVPEFRDWYPEALSHLRRLQSDDAVYLAAIERLKTTIATALKADRPGSLEAVFTEYAEKYPRLAGLDRLRRDLRQIIEVGNDAAARNLGPLIARVATLRLATPPFQEKLRALGASGRLPSAEVIAQYQAVSKAWQAGRSQEALDMLQKMAAGPWADAARADTVHKKTVIARYAELQRARGSKGYNERLLAFYGVLDESADGYFLQATAADLGQIRDQAVARAQELLGLAQAGWRQYRDNGGIDESLRQESEISPAFRNQARRLAEARAATAQARLIDDQLKVEMPEQWRSLADEIAAEATAQRNALLESRSELEPALLQAKLALIGGRHDEQ
ncbi:MAG: FHA domain-containing protein [Bacteroidota bacterium]